jgi:hypothetical protein
VIKRMEPQPATVEEGLVPSCLEGQVLDEDTGLCMLEEPEVTKEQPSEEEEDDSEENKNN